MTSLRQRLVLTHTLAALLAVVLMAVLASGFFLQAYRQLDAERSQDAARRVSVTLAPLLQLAGNDWERVAWRLGNRYSDAPIAADNKVILADTDWRIWVDSEDGEMVGQVVPLRWRNLAAPIQPQRGGAAPLGHVLVLDRSDGLDSAERNFLRNIVLITITGSIVAVGGASLAALWLSPRLIAPLRSLTHAANTLATGQAHTPLARPADRELADLAVAFNRMAAELAHAETLRQHMLADIAHELRTPLSVLRLQIESLQDGVEAPTPAVLDSLHQEVALLTRLVADLRLLSLAEAGQLALHFEALNPAQAVEHVYTAATPNARQRGVTLQVPPSRDALPAIRADSQRLTQVLGNLVENALRYTPPGGTVTLRAFAQQIPPGVAPRGQACGPVPGAWVVFEVRDTGPGIAPDDLQRIFERFYRTDRARTRETGGSGLGLSIVERFVHAQHGWVDVHSTVGRGTAFYVGLPLATSDASPCPAPTQQLTSAPFGQG